VRALVLLSPGGAPLDRAEVEAMRRTFRLRSHGEALAFIDRVFARPPRMRPFLAWGTRRKLAHPSGAGAARRARDRGDARRGRGERPADARPRGVGPGRPGASRVERAVVPRGDAAATGASSSPTVSGTAPTSKTRRACASMVLDFLRTLSLPAKT
jgi:hypothetical protein